MPLFRCLALLLLAAASASAGDAHAGHDHPPGFCVDAYCGLSAAHAAARLVGGVLKPDDLADPQYLSCANGSSLANLKDALAASGAAALVVDDLHPPTGRVSHETPVLAETIVDGSALPHYVLLVRHSRGGVDVLHRGRVVTGPDRLALLDGLTGRGLHVGASEGVLATHERSLAWRGRILTLLILVGGVAGVAGIHLVGRHSRFNTLLTCVALVAATLGAVGVSHAAHAAGFAGPGVVPPNLVRALLDRRDLVTVDASEAVRLHASGATFVDARDAGHHAARHIDGSLHIPTTATAGSRRAALAGVANDHPVVVYCNNAQCPYAELVARALLRDGHPDVRVFPGGMSEWPG